ncbi:phage tail protein [Paenibacillus sp. NPDC058174]|uniref:phage tail protein n=1 Tax=Paenibacillus sp. NPDC058174 TaxID=3346366 RepID=UPI0036D8B0C1
MADQFLGEIRIFCGNYPPQGWAFCNGGLLPISQNTALFSLLGTNYGGNGQSNFALPDLQGKAPMFWGQGPGLSDHIIGESGGSQSVTLINSEIPYHNHGMNYSNSAEPQGDPSNAFPTKARGRRDVNVYGDPSSGGALSGMHAQALNVAGGNLPHNNMQPYLAVSYIIALQGIFPARW